MNFKHLQDSIMDSGLIKNVMVEVNFFIRMVLTIKEVLAME